ncbi:hypothetical protein CDB3_07625 [Bacillus sp. CDB3]|nr:hypothetical protein CDB3_07625 [Bacillus sp. CDB3]
MFAPESATALHLAEHIQIEQLDVHSLHAFQLFLLQSQKTTLRYPIGKGVKFAIMMKKLLPWRWWKYIVLREFAKKK